MPRRSLDDRWLGRGEYPADTAGMRVTTDEDVWTDAVASWTAAHSYGGT